MPSKKRDSGRRLAPVLYLVLALAIVGGFLVPPASAATIWSDGILGSDGATPTGWTESGVVGTGSIEVDTAQSHATSQSLLVNLPASADEVVGTGPDFTRCTDTTCTTNIRVRINTVPTSRITFRFANTGNVALAGFLIETSLAVLALDGTSEAYDLATGTTLTEDTWYHVRFEIDVAADDYDFFIDDMDTAVLVDTATGAEGAVFGDGDSAVEYALVSGISFGAGQVSVWFDTFLVTDTTSEGGGGGGGGLGEEEMDVFDPPGCTEGSFDVMFESRFDDGLVNLYMWNFGDGSATMWTSQQQVLHEFPGGGKYTVTHAVQFNDGVTGRETHMVDVGFCDEPEIEVVVWGGYMGGMAAVMWVAFILTRQRRVLQIALAFTLIGAGIAVYAFGFVF